MQAQTQISQMESGQTPAPAAANTEQGLASPQPAAQPPVQGDPQQAQAQAVAQQAVYESQGFSSAAARMAAQTMNAGGSNASETSTPATSTAGAPAATGAQTMPHMQTGATMQAMANFQQAAAVSVSLKLVVGQSVYLSILSNVIAAIICFLCSLPWQQPWG
jgi:hypothetical protein